MADGHKRKQAPRMRLSAEKRDRFLEVLGQTGNRRYAAEAIGVEPRLMDQRREFDPVLDRGWEAALDQADRRLAGANGPFDCIGGRELNVIRRGPDGRLKIVASGPKRWNREVEDRFLAALTACGNLAAATRAIGFNISSVYQRRRKWADFERRVNEALDDAEISIEFRIATMGSDPGLDALGGSGTGKAGGSGEASTDAPVPFDADLAMRFLKWREEKRRGGGRRGRIPKPPSIEEVTETILRRVEAIKRHREREGEEDAPP